MKPKCIYPNTRSAAMALHRWIQENDIPLELTARPWNRFEPLNTEWWLIPSTKWPAYQHGKYFFWTPRDAHDLVCGLYVEKGLDPSVAVAFPTGKRLVMDNNWVWYRMIIEMASDFFCSVVAQVAERSKTVVRISVSGGFVEDPESYDPNAPPMDWSYVVFESTGNDLQKISSTLQGEQFIDLMECNSLTCLAQALERIPQAAWMWLNLHMGVRMEMASLDYDPGYAQNAWGASKLWEACLAPWRPWII